MKKDTLYYLVLMFVCGLIYLFIFYSFTQSNLLIGFIIGLFVGYLYGYSEEKHYKYGKITGVTTIKGQAVELVDLHKLKKQTKEEKEKDRAYNLLNDIILYITILLLFFAVIYFFVS